MHRADWLRASSLQIADCVLIAVLNEVVIFSSVGVLWLLLLQLQRRLLLLSAGLRLLLLWLVRKGILIYGLLCLLGLLGLV